MESSSGRPIQVEIPFAYTITVRGQWIRVFSILVKCKFLNKTILKATRARSRMMLIDRDVFSAIKMYEQSDGYADLKLGAYLEKMFNKDDK